MVLSALAKGLDATIGRQDVIVVVLGLLSAVIDNVPLVAATMGMYDLAHYPPDSFLWEFIAYCAGTGGSIRANTPLQPVVRPGPYRRRRSSRRSS